jgi:hypothetical protein
MEKIFLSKINQIKRLRLIGLSHREIASKTKVSLGSVFKYSKIVKLTFAQHSNLKLRAFEKGINGLSVEKRFLASRKGGLNTPSHFPQKYTKEILISFIKRFFEKYQRIPTKLDLPNLVGPAFRLFGTWNRLIIQSGFSPNPVLFAKKFIAKDGHHCDSFTEKIIDDWLSNHKIQHIRNAPYGKTKYTGDFKIGDVYVEFFGLHGQLKKYDEIMKKKIKYIRNHHLRLIDLYPKDIFPYIRLGKILKEKIGV